ncbi:MBL fold metallo-hydrolase [Gordonia sp. CPCC 205333]|uniref:MBL fold metallo-hydrolase n=1 Tax=Gordonia sp. CPCC 205333 TaxID=3140790 RepID=UPI003AF3BE22
MSTSTLAQAAAFGARAAATVTDNLAARGVTPARAVGASAADIAPHVVGSEFLRDGRFGNLEPPIPMNGSPAGAVSDMIRRPGRPSRPIVVTTPDFAHQARDLAVTWLGHATALLEIDGSRVLTDPVFSRRCSPSQLVGPGRMHPTPCAIADLPKLDVVLISHDHYDHLDMSSVIELSRTQPDAVFVAPIGVGAHLLSWGIPATRIRQTDWHGQIEVAATGGTLTFTATPARHFSGRGLARNLTQWVSWAIVGKEHRAFFSGDTGFTESYADVGARLGPFHLTLIAAGAYDVLWPDIHVNPEEAVQIHRMLTGDLGADAVLLPIHWGTFNLARHTWGDPMARVLASAAAESVTVLTPQPGGDIDLVTRTGSGTVRPDWWERSA